MGAPEPGGDPAGERVAAVAPVFQRDDDLVAGLWHGLEVGFGRIGDENFQRKARIIGGDGPVPAAFLEIADDGAAAALEHAGDLADFFAGPFALATVKDPHRDDVAGQGGEGFLGKNLQRGIARVAGTAVRTLENDEGGTAGAKLNAADQLTRLDAAGRRLRRWRGRGRFRGRGFSLAGGLEDGALGLAGPGGLRGAAQLNARAGVNQLLLGEPADFVRQLGALLFVEPEGPQQVGFLGRLVVGCPQMREQTVAKIHRLRSGGRARRPCFGGGLMKRGRPKWGDENRACRQ